MKPSALTRAAVRGHLFAVLTAVLILATGSSGFLSIRFLSSHIQTAVDGGARDALGGDFRLVRNRLIPDNALKAFLAEIGLDGLASARSSETLAMAHVVFQPDTALLVELVAVGDGFPLVGGPITTPPNQIRRLSSGEALIDRSLAEQFFPEDQPNEGAIEIGGLVFQVVGMIEEDPSREPRSLVTGPRVYVRRTTEVIESILGNKSRLEDKVVFLNPEKLPLPDESKLEELTNAGSESQESLSGLRIRDAEQHAAAMFRPLGRFTAIVELFGFATLLLSLFGTNFAISRIINSLIPQTVLMRALGAPSRLARHALQSVCVFVLLTGLLAGLLLSVGFFWFLLLPFLQEAASGINFAKGNFSTFLISSVADVVTVWAGVLLGAGIQLHKHLNQALLVPPLTLIEGHESALASAQARPPLAAGRSRGGLRWSWQALAEKFPRISAFALHGITVLLLGLILLGPGDSLVFALLGASGLLLVLVGMSRGILLLAKSRIAKSPAELRVSLLSIVRKPQTYALFVSTLGFALTIGFFMTLLAGQFMQPILNSTDRDRPNLFFLDVQRSQKEGFAQALQNNFSLATDSAPIVRGRIHSIGGVSVDKLLAEERARLDDPEESSRRLRFLQREHNFTYSKALDTETISAGTAWSSDPVQVLREVSVEEGFAETMGIELGSNIELDIIGTIIEAEVTSIRQVRWESGQLNFFLIAHPSLLAGAPEQNVFSTFAPKELASTELTRWLRQNYPNVTFIDVRSVVRRLSVVIDGMVSAIQLMSSLCLASAFLIYLSTLAHLHRIRAKDTALLRLMGGQSVRIKAGLVLEVIFLTTVAVMSSLLLALGLTVAWSWILVDELPRFAALNWAEAGMLILVLLALSIMIGLAGARSLYKNDALEALRQL